MLIREMALEDQPYVRADRLGTESLSTAELIAVVCGLPSLDPAMELMRRAGDVSRLTQMTIEEIEAVQSLGPARAQRLKAALALSARACYGDLPDMITGPEEAIRVVQPLIGAERQECLMVVSLDTKHHVLATDVIYRGNVNTMIVRMGEVFAPALRRGATAIILAHNHPSGDPTPSAPDISITRSARSAGESLDVQVLDHVIVTPTPQRWVSLKEKGLGF